MVLCRYDIVLIAKSTCIRTSVHLMAKTVSLLCVTETPSQHHLKRMVFTPAAAMIMVEP